VNDGNTVVFHLVGVPVFTSEQWKTLSMWDPSVVLLSAIGMLGTSTNCTPSSCCGACVLAAGMV